MEQEFDMYYIEMALMPTCYAETAIDPASFEAANDHDYTDYENLYTIPG